MMINNEKKVLVVVDMQRDFVTGSLKNTEAMAIVSNVVKKIAEYRNSGNEVVFTRDTHSEDYLNTNEGKKLPVVHCVKETDGWQIIPEIEVSQNDKVIDKPTFGSLELADYISTLNVDEIEIIGVCTGICVISNAMIIKAKFPEKKVVVDSTCCACVTPETHKNALKAMKLCQIDIV